MRRFLFAPLVLMLVFAVLPGRAQDDKEPAKPDKAAEKAKREKRPKIEDALRRAYAKAKADDDLSILRSTVIRSEDGEGEEALILIVEYSNGNVGIFSGTKDVEKDQGPIYIQKKDAAIVKDVFGRADSLYVH
jgi:hypothetical protein